MIIGTAGHIDHGKTSLVRALSGVDTDRLPEEKARGITIELGYAYTPLPNGDVLGFVDVPGHEKFVPTMLAGATGIDFALLVVAADDGIMPQTREHLNILTLLGVRAGAIALTKLDAVDAGRAAQVERDLRMLLGRSALAGAPIFPVSARSGAGIATLRSYLERQAQHHPSPLPLTELALKEEVGSREHKDGWFRLAVDRAFVLKGIGTVVTGTVHSGEVGVGARVIVAPAGRETRIRSIHAQNRPAEIGTMGQRCALSLAGIAKDDINRGDWIVSPRAALTTQRIDARLQVLADASTAMQSGATVHLHLGAAHVVARMVTLAAGRDATPPADAIVPGSDVLVQFVTQTPLAAWRGDRFIVRDAAASRTIGGGRVLDPFAPARYRRSPERLAILVALGLETPVRQLDRLVADASYGVDLARFALGGNVSDIDALLRSLAVRRVTSESGDFAVSDAHWESLQRRVTRTLAEFHAANGDEVGPDAARLRRMACPQLDDVPFRALIADLLRSGGMRQSGPWLHLPEHENAASPQERALLDRVLAMLLVTPFDPPWVRALAKDLALAEAPVRTAMMRASKRGELFQVVRDLFLHPAAIRDLAAIANDLQRNEGEVLAASFRDATGLGRKRAINILEFFDRIGFTRRIRDKHIVRAQSLLTLDVGPGMRDESGQRRDARASSTA